MVIRHYRLGWSATTACGIRAIDHRALGITRDPSRVSCLRCRAAILRMARTWDGVVSLGQVKP
jgi:hypothetical protein